MSKRGREHVGAIAVGVVKKPKFTGLRIRPHRHRPGDLYCVYSWWQTRIDGPNLPPRVPPGVTIPVGNVCMYCSRPRAQSCVKALSVSLVRGIWWDLTIGNIPSCTNCPDGPHFEIVPK